ncbi:hypothetical protein CPB85DRAFT_1338215 [Mucidula mucida]|nr:hypothetical protein CPB85DRAFT_1338215 [Mucidula mucida]
MTCPQRSQIHSKTHIIIPCTLLIPLQTPLALVCRCQATSAEAESILLIFTQLESSSTIKRTRPVSPNPSVTRIGSSTPTSLMTMASRLSLTPAHPVSNPASMFPSLVTTTTTLCRPLLYPPIASSANNPAHLPTNFAFMVIPMCTSGMTTSPGSSCGPLVVSFITTPSVSCWMKHCSIHGTLCTSRTSVRRLWMSLTLTTTTSSHLLASTTTPLTTQPSHFTIGIPAASYAKIPMVLRLLHRS